jgi:hypothetical protein
MEKSSQIAWKIVPLKVVPLIEVLLYQKIGWTAGYPVDNSDNPRSSNIELYVRIGVLL